jgi:hypothetical protein
MVKSVLRGHLEDKEKWIVGGLTPLSTTHVL